MNDRIRRIDIMTLYRPQCCLDAGAPWIKIKQVRNRKGDRLSRTEGSVNLTDFWFAMLDIAKEWDLSYSCQHFGLFSDDCVHFEEGRTISDELGPWWNAQDKQWVCICFLKVVSDNRKMAIQNLKNKISEEIEGGKVFRTIDNADLFFVFSGKSKEEMIFWLEELQNKCQNLFFSNFYIYGKAENCEDGIKIKDCKTGGSATTHKLYDGWCKNTVSQLREKLNVYMSEKNKKMASYYQALLRIVGAVAQYEQAPIRKDLFLIFYPPISLFLEQLEQGEKEIEKINWNLEAGDPVEEKIEKMQRIETSITEFIDSMELLLHHMGSSCIDIMNSSGRGGMPYDIPIRLCLMYVSYLHVVSSILNDNENYEYQFCLAPLTYSCPSTNCFDFGLEPASRLIRVLISRHAMFMPRPMLTILAHEASHYVGDTARARIERAEHYKNILAIVLTELLIPAELEEFCEEEEVSGYVESKKKELYAFFQKEMTNSLIERRHKNKYVYHFRELNKEMDNICRNILFDEKHLLENAINMITENTLISIRKHEADFEDIKEINRRIEENVQRILMENKFFDFRDSLEESFREIFADINSMLLLDLGPIDMLEAYLVSESYLPDEDVISPLLLNRISMVNIVMSEYDQAWKNQWESLGETDLLKSNNFLVTLKHRIDKYTAALLKSGDDTVTSKIDSSRDFFLCYQVFEEEKEYFFNCYNYLKDQIGKSVEKKALLLNLYKQFDVYKPMEEQSFDIFFNAYENLVDTYREYVVKKYGKSR